ncbi:hypothetical protein P0D87_19315 [Paraburkholderia sp. RL17-368-BIF-A]|jgi:signal transduction histidine kinase|uniref:hypothetical protein n=1 Tax=Paraburkholderia sp. RL17-368-BIF-A TaxID=3031628 RepID=UPI0006B3F5D8|nr:histidine kinase [Burkholderia sp. HB1]
MLASLRRIAADLRPPVLDDLGLGAALEWLTDDFTQHFYVKVTLRIAVDDSAVPPFASATGKVYLRRFSGADARQLRFWFGS